MTRYALCGRDVRDANVTIRMQDAGTEYEMRTPLAGCARGRDLCETLASTMRARDPPIVLYVPEFKDMKQRVMCRRVRGLAGAPERHGENVHGLMRRTIRSVCDPRCHVWTKCSVRKPRASFDRGLDTHTACSMCTMLSTVSRESMVSAARLGA